MTYFIRNGNKFSTCDESQLDIKDELPVGNYIIEVNPMSGELFLSMIDPFKPISKYYGDTLKVADRIFNTFSDRTASTGVLLCGEKGSGKTLLAKRLSIQCAEQGMPTIVINSPWTGDKFFRLIQSITQPCMIIFDEFEKVYEKKEQESILTLLDGTYPTRKLFVLTCNNKWAIDANFHNRPGRVFYSLNFDGLTADFIREYCQDRLHNKDHIESVVRVGSVIGKYNFDMLQAVVEDMNRYKENIQDTMKFVNARLQHSLEREGRINYQVELWNADGSVATTVDYHRTRSLNHPLTLTEPVDIDGYEGDKEVVFEFLPGDIIIDDGLYHGRFTFVNAERERLVLTAPPVKEFDFSKLL